MHLQVLKSGATVQVEVRPDQRSNIDIICRVRNAEVTAEENCSERLILLTLRKK